MKTKYDIHPDFARFPVLTFKFNALLLGVLNAISRLVRSFSRRKLGLQVEEHFIERPDGSRLKVLTMTPHALARPAPALVYYHGGAFALTYASLHLLNCARYAREAECIVVFVEYRLAPRNPFPDGFDDCYRTLEWVLSAAADLNVDAGRIAVGGDSAGGALAAGVAQKARDAHLPVPCAQMLIYPVLDDTCSTSSATEYVDVPLWNALSNRAMWMMYLARYRNEAAPLYAAPGHGSTQGLPLSYVETAEFDPLRDEGLEYAVALRAQGVNVIVNETRQTVHGFDGNARSALSQQAVKVRIEFLRQAFSQPPCASTILEGT